MHISSLDAASGTDRAGECGTLNMLDHTRNKELSNRYIPDNLE